MLPAVSQQILCIHLKRFRHELMFSMKIGTHVSFPLEGLEMQPFLAKDSSAQTTTYDLLSVICHHGTASSKWQLLEAVPVYLHWFCMCTIEMNGCRRCLVTNILQFIFFCVFHFFYLFIFIFFILKM